MVDFLNQYFDPANFRGGLGGLLDMLPALQTQLKPGGFPTAQPQAGVTANQPSPLDDAQWPAGPKNYYGQDRNVTVGNYEMPQFGSGPKSDPMDANAMALPKSAPLSIAPPAAPTSNSAAPAAAEAPGFLGNLQNKINENSNLLLGFAGGLAGGRSWGDGLSKGLSGAMQGGQLDTKYGNQNLTQQALIKKGLDPTMARAVAANPALLASVAGTLFKPQVRGLTPAEKSQAGLPEGLPWFVGADGKPFVPDGLSQLKPTHGVIGKDQFGVEQYGWIDPQTRTTTPAQSSTTAPAAGPSAIPAPPPGVDPKVWREKQSERAVNEALPADSKTTTQLRQEVQGLPSYKNLAQAAPVYRSMVDAAGRDNRAADVNLIYGMAKIMDPGSVVRESEMSVAQAIATLPQRLQAEVKSQVEKTGRLTPELRQDIMQEANSRIKSYNFQFEQDAGMTRGIAERGRMDTRDVIPDFGKFDEWKAPQKPQPNTPGPSIKPKPGGNYIWQNGRLVAP